MCGFCILVTISNNGHYSKNQEVYRPTPRTLEASPSPGKLQDDRQEIAHQVNLYGRSVLDPRSK